jgi:hypothetical protein
LLPGQIALTEHRSRHAKVLEHTRTLRIQGIGGGLLKTLVGVLVAFLLEKKTAVVVEDSRIGGAGGQGLAKMLVGQFGSISAWNTRPSAALASGSASSSSSASSAAPWLLGHALLQVAHPSCT